MTPRIEEIQERVNKVIREVLRVKEEALAPQARIREDLGADSLDVVSLLMALEDEFNDSINDEEAGRLGTMGDIVQFICMKARAAQV